MKPFETPGTTLNRRKKKKWWHYIDLLMAAVFALDVLRRNLTGSGGDGYGRVAVLWILLGMGAVAVFGFTYFRRGKSKSSAELGSQEQESLARHMDGNKKIG
jgi:hypothetical protein